MHLNLKAARCVLALIIAAIISGCASVLDESEAVTRIPYTLRNDGRITIAVMINDKGPFVLALDTAASISAVSKRPMEQLGLEAESGRHVFVHGAVASGEFPLVRLERLAIGSQRWIAKDVVALTGDSWALRQIDGIVGLDILKGYAVGFSARSQMLSLYAPESVESRAFLNWSSVPLVMRPIGQTGAFVYSVMLQIKGQKIPALFDLGAELNVVNSVAASRFGLTLHSKDDGEFSGAIDSTPILASLSIDEVATRYVLWRDERFYVADLPVFKQFKLAASPAAIVGATLFTQRDFIIDFSRQRLLIRKSMNEVLVPTEAH